MAMVLEAQNEIDSGGTAAQSLLSADTNGDGVVTPDELLSYITKKMENGKMVAYREYNRQA